MKSKASLLCLLVGLTCFGNLFIAERSYAADPGTTTITAIDGTGVSTSGNTTTVIPVNVSGRYALSSYSQFDLTAGDNAIMVLPGSTQYYINRIDFGSTNPFNIYGNLESRLGSAGGDIGGHLIFISRNGIFVGPNASINTGALTLTTANYFKVQDTSGTFWSLHNATLPGATLKDLNQSVISYESIAPTLFNPVVVNEGVINTLVTDPENSINIVAGSIINKGAEDGDLNYGVIGSADTKIVNLITANKATYNPITNTYDTSMADSEITESGMGGISITIDSQVLGNQITMKAVASDPTALQADWTGASYNETNLPNVAINIDGVVIANQLGTNGGTVKLLSESSNTNTTVRIAKDGVGSDGKVQANGTNANINIVGQKIDIKNTTADATPIVQSDGGINMHSLGLGIIDAGVQAGDYMNIQSDAGFALTDTNLDGNSYLLSGGNSTISSDTLLQVEKGAKVESGGNLTLNSGSSSIIVDGELKTTGADGDLVLNSGSSISIEDWNADGSTLLTSNNDIVLNSTTTTTIQDAATINAENVLDINSAGNLNITGGSDLTSTNNTYIDSGGTIATDANISSGENMSINGQSTIDVSSTSTLTAKNIEIANSLASNDISIDGTLNSTGIDNTDGARISSSGNLNVTGTITSANKTALISTGDTNLTGSTNISAGNDFTVDAGGLAAINGTISEVNRYLKIKGDSGVTIATPLISNNLMEVSSISGDVNINNTLTNNQTDIFLAGNNLNINDDINANGIVTMVSSTNTILDAASVDSAKTYIVAGNELSLINNSALTSNGNTYIKTPNINLAGSIGNINTSYGDIYIGHVPPINLYNYTIPPIPGSSITITIGGTSKINAGNGTRNILFGAGDGTEKFNNIIIDGISFQEPKIIDHADLQLALQPKLTASKLNFFWDPNTETAQEIIDENSDEVNEAIVTATDPDSFIDPYNTYDTYDTGDIVYKDEMTMDGTKDVPLYTEEPDGGIINFEYDNTEKMTLETDVQDPNMVDTNTQEIAFKEESPEYLESTETDLQPKPELAEDNTLDSQENQEEPANNEYRAENQQENPEEVKSEEENQESKIENDEEDLNEDTKIAENNEETDQENKKSTEFVKEYGILKVNKKNFKNYYGDNFTNSIATYNASENEYTADVKGMEFASKSGYHPAGMAGYLLSVNDLEKSPKNNAKMNNLFSYRHPKTVNRLGKLKTEITDYKQNDQLKGLTRQKRFSEIQNLIH